MLSCLLIPMDSLFLAPRELTRLTEYLEVRFPSFSANAVSLPAQSWKLWVFPKKRYRENGMDPEACPSSTRGYGNVPARCQRLFDGMTNVVARIHKYFSRAGILDLVCSTSASLFHLQMTAFFVNYFMVLVQFRAIVLTACSEGSAKKG